MLAAGAAGQAGLAAAPGIGSEFVIRAGPRLLVRASQLCTVAAS